LARAEGGLELCAAPVFTNTDDPDYKQLLTVISAAAEKLAQRKRFDMPGFRPNEHYIREMQRFGILPASLKPNDSIDVYATDQAYWKSFWYRPASKTAVRLLDKVPAASVAAAGHSNE
jgi:hypothetical protein